MTDDRAIDHEPWPTRPLLLLGLGAIAGLLAWLLLGFDKYGAPAGGPLRLGLAAFLIVGGIAFAITLERLRAPWSAAFAAAAGLAVGLVVWSKGDPDVWTSNSGWRFAASLLAVAIAIPLFQAMRDSGSRRFAPGAALDHAWTDAILWVLSCGFVILVWVILVLLGGLFGLIGIVSVRQLLIEPWFMLTLFGGTLGAIIGLLRDRDSVLALLHRVARTILSVLAPILGAGLLLFVAALAFTGLGPLWRETEATTPILLACIAVATILANAVIGNAREEEPKARILAWGAMALGAAMLPLAIVAAISMSKRIGQYGFSPDRLWAAVVVGIALIVSAAYLAALVRGRSGWAPILRRTNVALAAGIGAVALLLALPILDFGAISARDQVARLESGKIAPDKFDWHAMRFDFGPAGKAAVERLSKSGDPILAGLARRTLALDRSESWKLQQDPAPQREFWPAEIIVRPAGAPVPADLRELILRRSDLGGGICTGPGACLLFWKPGQDHAIVMLDGCASRIVGAGNQASPDEECSITPTVLERDSNGHWRVAWTDGILDLAEVEPISPPRQVTPAEARKMLEDQRAALERGDVEVREVRRRQLFIGGKPEGEAFD